MDLQREGDERGVGAISTFGKNKLGSSLLEGTGTYTVSSNQSHKWVESHSAEQKNKKKSSEKSLDSDIFYSKLLELLSPVANVFLWTSLSILTVYGHLFSLHHSSVIFPNCCSSKLCLIVLFIPWHWNSTSQLSNQGWDSRITNSGGVYVDANSP